MINKILLALFIPFTLYSQSNTDIYLFDIEISESSVRVSNPINISNRVGYDNQAFFHTEIPIIYYSSFDEDDRSDIKYYDIESGETIQFCKTKDREYSPTLTPDKKYISCILQTDEGKQNLVKYPIEGGDPITIIDDLIVGYHSWINKDELLLFVLGEPEHFLVKYNLKNNEKDTITSSIGRAIHKIPNKDDMSYIQKTDSTWNITSLKKQEIITQTIEGSEDLCWTNNGMILMSDGSDIYFFNGKWNKVSYSGPKDFMKGITRLAISEDNTKLTVVVEESTE